MTRVRTKDGPSLLPSEAGFTLIEVMSAMTILAIAMIAVFATFTSQQKAFTVQSRVAEMQQNLRDGVECMIRDIRLAGYGTPDNVTIPNGVIAAGVTTMGALYATDGGAAGTDQIHVLYLYDMDAYQPAANLSSAMVSTATSISVDNVFGFVNGDLILVKSESTADLFQITGAPAGNTLPHDTSGFNSSTAHPSWPAGGYLNNPPATVAKARFVRYFIDNTTDPDHPMLMVDRMGGQPPQPAADDIEDLQLAYGLDTSGDGAVDTWRNGPGDPILAAAEIPQVRQVRIQLMARTRLPDSNWSETRSALGNRSAGAAPDGYRRRVFDILIDVRNSGA
jgi:type IV pilus assembly protein PilW